MEDTTPLGMVNLRRLRVWQSGQDLVVAIYHVTKGFPADERYGLTAQLRRAAVSVPSNIAEGVERFSAAERRRYLIVARSSLAEIETQLEAATRLGFVDSEGTRGARELADHLSRMLFKMIRRFPDHP